MLRCPPCHDDLRNDHARLRCTHCETQVHAGCRSLSRGRCPTLGCKGTLPGGSRRKRFSPRFQPPLRSLTLGRLAATSGGVALGTCLLLAATVFSLFMADYHGPLWGLLAVGCVAGYLVGLPAFALRGALNQRGNPLRGSLMGYALISLIPGHVLGVLACLALCVVGREGGVIASIVLEPALVTLFGGLFLGRLVQRDALQPQPSRERCLAPAPPLPSARRQIKIHLAPRAAAA